MQQIISTDILFVNFRNYLHFACTIYFMENNDALLLTCNLYIVLHII
jgi:hypothetical protein